MSGTAEGPGDGAWRCAQCGTANPADVTECLYCGESSTGGQPAKRKGRPFVIAVKLLCAVGVGVLVFIVGRDVAYNGFRDSPLLRRPGESTLRDIANVRQAIEGYRQEHQALPDSLADLSLPEDARLRTDEAGRVLDGWGRPLQYLIDGTEYELVSYGRNGEPGGLGLDADLWTADLPEGEVDEHQVPPLPERALPTFEQFFGDRGEFGRAGSGHGMFQSCVVTGVVAFLVAFVVLLRSRTGPSSVVSLILTTVGAIVVSVVIASLHAPTGH